VAELIKTLEKKFSRKLKPVVTVDPSLIGGVRVVVGDEVLDTSVNAKLQQLRSALVA
jgi:F-type H+-transporting ATPase subunit delta